MLEDILANLKKLFSSSENESVVGLDVGMTSVKMVQIRKQKGAFYLETYGEIALGPYKDREVGEVVKLSEKELSQVIQDIMREANITSDKVVVSVPYINSFMVTIELPRLSDEEINKMIPFEARKYIPLKMEEIALDWIIIPDEAKGEWIREEKENPKKTKEVLLVATHNNFLSFMKDTIDAAGLKALGYELEVFSIIRSSVETSTYPIAILDIGGSASKVYVVERGIPKVAHIVNISSKEITEAISRSLNIDFKTAESRKREIGLSEEKGAILPKEEFDLMSTAIKTVLSRILSDVKKVFLEYEKKYDKDISKLYLAGAGSMLPGLDLFLKENLQTIDIEFANPFSLTRYPDFLDSILKKIGPDFAVSVGLAIKGLKG